VRKRRDPSARPLSRQGVPNKPTVKSGAVQRESEGTVVPVIVATNNAAGGKGPCGGCAGKGGKHEGMVQPTTMGVLVGESPTGALSEGAVAKTDGAIR
jgi:hypothetical protein